jgi:hypothetical protein
LQRSRSITEKQQTLGWGKSVVETLSEDYKNLLPSPEEIASKLIDFNLGNNE